MPDRHPPPGIRGATAGQQGDRAGTERSQFLAKAVHDLRQSLQTLSLLEGLLMKVVEGDKARMLVARVGQTIGPMADILNTMLDINRSGPTDPVTLHEQLPSIPPLPVESAPSPQARPQMAANRASPVIFIVDDDPGICDAMRSFLEDEGRCVETFPSSEAFLAAYQPGREACLLIDAYLPGMSGLELLKRLSDAGDRLPAIMITGNSDVQMAVQAMKAGAIDFIEKPVASGELKACVERAIELSRDANKAVAHRENAARHVASLSPRQREIMALVLAGHPSKNIAADLGISQRTVENHRAAIMTRMDAKSLPALARQALAARD